MRILLIEDDLLITRDVKRHLETNGYVVEHEKDGEAGWFRGDGEEFAAAVLDLGLPELDGLSVLKRWRQSERELPVLILTARGSWQERVEGIDAGADDYLAKPFQMPELLARLRAIIRRSQGKAAPILRAGRLGIDPRTKVASMNDVPVELTPLEYRCLNYLMAHGERHVSQMELTEQLYAQDFERESNSVEVLIGRLRKKFGKDIISTRRGYGYRIGEA